MFRLGNLCERFTDGSSVGVTVEVDADSTVDDVDAGATIDLSSRRLPFMLSSPRFIADEVVQVSSLRNRRNGRSRPASGSKPTSQTSVGNQTSPTTGSKTAPIPKSWSGSMTTPAMPCWSLLMTESLETLLSTRSTEPPMIKGFLPRS